MSNDDEITPKPTEEPKDEAPARARKIVRRSASTRDNPAFAEGQEKGEVEAGEAGAPAARAEGAPADAGAESRRSAPAPSVRRFDARAPRPRPAEGEARPQPRGPRPDAPGRSSRGDYRPPPARPIGARPIPGGPRAPASPGSGDYRPPPARPIGARPIPGGPRAPASEFAERREGPRSRPDRPGRPDRPERADRPHGDRPSRGPDRDRGGEHAQARAHRGEGEARPPAAKPAVQAPPPPESKPAAHAKVAAAKPMPVFIPLPRAGFTSPASQKPALTPKEALAAKTKAFAAKSGGKPAQKAPEAPAQAAPSIEIEEALVNVAAHEAVAAIAKAGEGAVQLIDAWLAASNAGAIVEASESDAVSGAARKAARRALNVLRSRGVAIPARAHVVKLDDRVEVSLEATLIPPDSSGTIAVSITSKDASGRYHIAEVIVREPIGILQAGSGWLSGSQLKDGRNRAMDQLGVAPVMVPVEWARHRIASARKLNAVSGQVLPLGLEGCTELIEPTSADAPAHPLADVEGLVTAELVTEVVPGSERLHNEAEFGTWLPDRGSLDELLQKVGERLGPQGVSDPEAVNVALREEIEAATDRFFSPEIRSVVAARMRDSAISLRARKGDRAAAEALAIARAITEAGLITSPPREIPFLLTFFRKALGIMAQQGGGQLRVPVVQQPPAQPAQQAT